MIKVQKIKVSGLLEVDVDLPDLKTLEKFRKQLAESYQAENQQPFEISFQIQSENFTDVEYPKQKRKA